MSYVQKTTIKRIPTGRPLTPKEHDENLEAIDTTNTRVQAEFDLRMPVGTIVMWSGSSAAVPPAFALCNGQTKNGVVTPDLRGRFVVGGGAGSGYTDGQTGGSDSIGNHVHSNPDTDGTPLLPSDLPQLTGNTTTQVENLGAGSNLNTSRGGGTTNTGYQQAPVVVNASGGTTQHIHTQGNTGGAGAHDNRPKFYAIAYIMFVDYTQPS